MKISTDQLRAVTDPVLMSALQEYFQDRIDEIKNNLTTASSMEQVYKFQGAIQELKRLLDLKQILIQKRDNHGIRN